MSFLGVHKAMVVVLIRFNRPGMNSSAWHESLQYQFHLVLNPPFPAHTPWTRLKSDCLRIICQNSRDGFTQF